MQSIGVRDGRIVLHLDVVCPTRSRLSGHGMIARRRRALGRRSEPVELRIPAARGIRPYVPYLDGLPCERLKSEKRWMPPIAAEGRVPNRGVAFQLFERRTTTGQQPGNDSSFPIVSSMMQNAPPGIVRRRGVDFAPLAGRKKHSRSASSGSGRCADFLSRTLILRVRRHSVFPRITGPRRARADGGARGYGERSAELVAGECEHQSE